MASQRGQIAMMNRMKSLACHSLDPDVLFETRNQKGVIILNRPKILNSLNLSMATKMLSQLKTWESTQQFVIIKASGGKAFCAGGDIRAVIESVKRGGYHHEEFFREEYRLNALIGTLSIPYIALIDGITMGGGVGLSVHGNYRIATERTVFAMPETRIGLFPDVGTSYILPRLGGKLGLYLALTGQKLAGSDVFKAGIATHLCRSQCLNALEQDLLGVVAGQEKHITALLEKYHKKYSAGSSLPPFSLNPHLKRINELFTGSTIEDILDNLRKDGSGWANSTLCQIHKMSPTSLKITKRLLEEGEQLELQEALKLEYRLAVRCCEKHDFPEGVRALLIDKDNNPTWDPPTLPGVSKELVESHFAPFDSKSQELVL